MDVQVVDDIDVVSIDKCQKLATAVTSPIDIVINNAGYFYEPVEKIDSMNFDEVSLSLFTRRWSALALEVLKAPHHLRFET